MGCPDAFALSAFRQELLPPEEGETLARHTVDCRECQRVLLLLGQAAGRKTMSLPHEILDRLKTLRPRRAFPRWAAAAAVFLLAAGIWLIRPVPSPGPRSPSVQPSSLATSFPAGPLDASSHLARGAEILLEPGCRARAEGRRIRLEAGTLWLEVAQGEPATLEVPGDLVTLAQGEISASVPHPRRTAWIASAFAGEEASTVEVRVLAGEALLPSGARAPAGTLARLTDKGWLQEPISEQALDALRMARAEAATRCPGRDLIPPGLRLRDAVGSRLPVPPAYRWVTVLEKRDASTEVTLVLGAGGAWHRWVLGLAAAPPRPREIVEVVWDGERMRGRLNGRQVFSCSREELGRVLPPAEGAWSLSVLGGGATVVASKLQEAR